MKTEQTQTDAAGAVQPELEIRDAERKQMGGHGDIEPFIGFSATVRIKGRAGIAHFQSSDHCGTEYGVSKEETEAIMHGMVTAYNERPALLARIAELEAMLHGKREEKPKMGFVCWRFKDADARGHRYEGRRSFLQPFDHALQDVEERKRYFPDFEHWVEPVNEGGAQ